MVTSEAVVLTLQRDEEMEEERGTKKKEERSADKTFCVRQFAALSSPPTPLKAKTYTEPTRSL